MLKRSRSISTAHLPSVRRLPLHIILDILHGKDIFCFSESELDMRGCIHGPMYCSTDFTDLFDGIWIGGDASMLWFSFHYLFANRCLGLILYD